MGHSATSAWARRTPAGTAADPGTSRAHAVQRPRIAAVGVGRAGLGARPNPDHLAGLADVGLGDDVAPIAEGDVPVGLLGTARQKGETSRRVRANHSARRTGRGVPAVSGCARRRPPPESRPSSSRSAPPCRDTTSASADPCWIRSRCLSGIRISTGLALAGTARARAAAKTLRRTLSRAVMRVRPTVPGRVYGSRAQTENDGARRGVRDGRGRAFRPALCGGFFSVGSNYQVLLTHPPPEPEHVRVIVPLAATYVNTSGPPEPSEVAISV